MPCVSVMAGPNHQPWAISISIVPQVALAPRVVETPVAEAAELNQAPCSVDDGTSSTV